MGPTKFLEPGPPAPHDLAGPVEQTSDASGKLPPYPVDFLRAQRGKLQDEARRLSEFMARARQAGLRDPQRDAVGELSAVDNHPADLGSETLEREKDRGLEAGARRLFADVGDALRRLDSGTYGACKRCGKWIPRERLEALPQASYCLECEVELEEGESLATRAGGRRPPEEKLLSPPFSRTWRPDQVAYDGEDTWQDVARFGTSDTPSDVPRARRPARAYENPAEPRGTVEEIEELAKTDAEGDVDDDPDVLS